jgi:3-hydroxyacyl-[acyl-carrier-protein] dehydratase
MRYVFIDRISSLTPGESLRAVKNVTATDDLVTRYAPGVRVFPASMVLEAMAQAAGLLAVATIAGRALPVLAKVRPFTSYRDAVPGDQLSLDARLEDVRVDGCRASVNASIESEPVGAATIYLAFVPFQEAAADARAPVMAALADAFPAWFAAGGPETPQ